jgi:hypothetical protein
VAFLLGGAGNVVLANQRSEWLDEIDNYRADRCDGVSDTGIDRFGHFADKPALNVTQCVQDD